MRQLALLPALCLLTACTDPALELEGDATAGAAIYSEHCASCHGADGTGGTGADLTEHLGHHSRADALRTIREGDVIMPGFDELLTDQELADLLAHLFESWG